MRELLTGPPAYRADTPWRALAAVAMAVAIVLMAIGLATVAAVALDATWSAGALDRNAPAWRTAVWLLAFQGTVVALVLSAATLGRQDARRVLSLGDAPSGRLLAGSIALMFLLMLPYNAIVTSLAREQVVQDLRSFVGPLRSDAAGLFALAIAIGAPLSEELLFRGFLLGALARSRLGFFGAALFTTAGWTALHAGYSGLGLLEVFVAGLFFSWLLWRTGNLWVPILCHSLYNSLMLVVVWLAPLPR